MRAFAFACVLAAACLYTASAVIVIRSAQSERSCVAEDLKQRILFQNKLAADCEEMCKNVGKYPDCNCVGFVKPDSTPGVMTWDELREHLRNLSSWGQDTLKQWHSQASMVQTIKSGQGERACIAADMKRRVEFQNLIATECEDMCKNVGKFPNCNCPGFVAPDSTPGVMTWDELRDHMGNLVNWGHDTLKGWRQQSSQLQRSKQTVSKSLQSEQACVAEDLKRRSQIQNKLADKCEDMCKNVGAYPDCTCPNFVQPDSTPGVMTWEELLTHMDNLEEFGQGKLKAWHQQASQLQKSKQSEQACASEDLKHRMQIQNKLADQCEDMCKNVGAYPDCTCPNFVQPDSTPGVMTWEELLTHMDNLEEFGQGKLKAWRQQASQLQKGKQSEQACASEDLKHRVQVQNKLADQCEDMCKNVGAYPDCTCPNFVQPDSTPGVMTWEELLTHMDNLEAFGKDKLKAWHQQAP